MLTYDLAPLLRTAVGFERLARQIEAASKYDGSATYPPYNIENPQEDVYRITIAAAGFDARELQVEVEENTLQVSGQKSEPSDDGKAYLYRGIASRDFVRKFELADYVKVTGANYSDGLLTIDLVREIPEELKPRTIQIKSEAPKSLFEKAKKLIDNQVRKDKKAA